MRHGLGLVIGKFLPPHRGHRLLIDTAKAQSDAVVVIVCARRDDPIAGELRGAWLRELHPDATVMVIDDHFDPDDSQLWADHTRRWLGRAPDAVFTSEDYGARYALLLGARHVLVDRQRLRVPISATQVRADPFLHWRQLEPPVRGHYCKRVCVLGAESTGTTTLAAALAAALGTTWVAEYGREVSAQKLAANDPDWRSREFETIAAEQARREDAAARTADRVLVCDTNAFATGLWHRRYIGGDSEAVAAIARAGHCDLYLLTGDEIPFVQDGLRDGEHLRAAMHGWFEAALAAQPVPWHVLRGSPSARLQRAVRLTADLFAGSRWRPRHAPDC